MAFPSVWLGSLWRSRSLEQTADEGLPTSVAVAQFSRAHAYLRAGIIRRGQPRERRVRLVELAALAVVGVCSAGYLAFVEVAVNPYLDDLLDGQSVSGVGRQDGLG